MRIDGETRLFGVVGDPIRQIKTPARINTIFKARGSHILCIPFHAANNDFTTFWQGIKIIKNVIGFGVTVPHKKSARQLCNSLSPAAERIGVVNVVRRRPDGGFHGDIFDGLSFVQGLKSEGFDPRGHEVFVYGAGGAATAICYALIDAGVRRISVQNRTFKNAEILVKQLQLYDTSSRSIAVHDFNDSATMVINASSLGMNKDDPLPVDPCRLNAKQIVAEVVASPEITPFLSEAKSSGCAVHSGIHMINHQMEILADFVEARGGRDEISQQ